MKACAAMKALITTLSVAVLLGCSSTDDTRYPDLAYDKNNSLEPKLALIERFPAAYPLQSVRRNQEGCATIEYVVAPDYSVIDIVEIASSSRYFADSAKRVVQKWPWSDLPMGTITKPTKLQTRFEFCLDEPNQSCIEREPENICPGDDVIYSTGSIIKRL